MAETSGRPSLPRPGRGGAALRLTLASVGGSLSIGVVLLVIHVLFRSQLALAQAADSVADTLAGGVLLWAMRQSSRPADAEHPHGHSGAEPIGALVVAVLAGVFAIEVARESIVALAGAERAELDAAVALAFGAKVIFKLAIVITARATRRVYGANPGIDALAIDARNDVLVGSVAVIGFAIGRAGLPAIDPLLAIGIAIYVGYSAWKLARENVELLMGRAAPESRRSELAAIAAAIPGVQRVDHLIATFHGVSLEVHVEVTVEPSLSLRDAHAIGHAIEERISREEDVSRTVAHVQPPDA